MKNVHAVLLLLTVGITTVHSFQCYECFTKVPDVNYTTEQCLTEQVKVECTSDKTCVRYYSEESGRDQLESRACVSKDQCRVFEEYCANDTRKEEDGTTVCQVNCCVSDGDTPCNGESDSGNNSNDNNNNNNSTLRNNNNNNNNNSNSALVVSTNRMVEMLTMMALLATDMLLVVR